MGIEPDAEKSNFDRRGDITPLYYWLERLGL